LHIIIFYFFLISISKCKIHARGSPRTTLRQNTNAKTLQPHAATLHFVARCCLLLLLLLLLLESC
jgi:hypothetical protein